MDAACVSTVAQLLCGRAADAGLALGALLAAAGLSMPEGSTIDSLWQQLAGAGFVSSVLPLLLAMALGVQLALLLCPPAKRDVFVLDFAVHKPCSRWVRAKTAEQQPSSQPAVHRPPRKLAARAGRDWPYKCT